ncbi:MAG: ABZJ_00895 family protein [Pseudomonadota bacterium]
MVSRANPGPLDLRSLEQVVRDQAKTDEGLAVTRKSIFWQFLSASILGQVSIWIIGSFFDGLSLNGVSFVIPFIAATFTAGQFLKKAERLPTQAEKESAVRAQFWGWAALSLGLAIVGLAIIAWLDAAVLSFLADPLFAGITALVLAVLFGLQWLMIRYAWGGQMRRMAKKMKLDTPQS